MRRDSDHRHEVGCCQKRDETSKSQGTASSGQTLLFFFNYVRCCLFIPRSESSAWHTLFSSIPFLRTIASFSSIRQGSTWSLTHFNEEQSCGLILSQHSGGSLFLP